MSGYTCLEWQSSPEPFQARAFSRSRRLHLSSMCIVQIAITNHFCVTVDSHQLGKSFQITQAWKSQLPCSLICYIYGHPWLTHDMFNHASYVPTCPKIIAPCLPGCAEVLLLYCTMVVRAPLTPGITCMSSRHRMKTEVDANESTTVCGWVPLKLQYDSRCFHIIQPYLHWSTDLQTCICYLKKMDSKKALKISY